MPVATPVTQAKTGNATSIPPKRSPNQPATERMRDRPAACAPACVASRRRDATGIGLRYAVRAFSASETHRVLDERQVRAGSDLVAMGGLEPPT